MEEEIEELEKDMTPVLLEDLGLRFTSDTKKYKARYGLYQCQYCGKEWEVQIKGVKSGNTKSCGCKSKKFNNPHGLTQHRLYNTWALMKSRCYNLKDKDYVNYGARGIQVCDRWLDIGNFIEDMYPSWEEGLTLDRVILSGNYEPDNCRWATKQVQGRNRRDIISTNTSGYRGVSWHKGSSKWIAQIRVNSIKIHLGYYQTVLEAAKAYERYVRLNNLEHNFTPVLSEEEIKELDIQGSINGTKI